jgi:hypothetical protein
MATPGTAEAVAYLRAHLAGDLDTQATILAAAIAGGLPAVGAFVGNLALMLDHLTTPDQLAALLDRVQTHLVDAR